MTREFIHTAPFLKCWKAMGLNTDDLTTEQKEAIRLLIEKIKGE